ncbi:Heat-labile enterotoxin IIA, A chain [Beauveria brongniartii RCEF 3172]|uniref:Heat-labile enterotoxin IIA, A chain n=1 Tax=Beauveria brongniartii RCEF 3172 TaxID=1081107 RepID=A0A167L7S8_9HYPO|nr:Heat-labile enterotoxin IIA, A chain [Beauveria brongniartii RCEF 3172]
MKIEFIHLALLGLSSTGLAMMDRPAMRLSSPSNHLKDAIIYWDPGRSRQRPTSQHPPIKNMPDAVPTYRKPTEPPKLKPSKPKLSKPKPFKPKPSKPIPIPQSRVSMGTRLAYKPIFFKVPKAAGKASVFLLVAPYAHQALETIKSMDNFLGYGATWFDDYMADLQVSIGGPQRNDIYGNELKHRMITSMGSAMQMGFETTWDKNKRLENEAAAREEARRREEAKEKERIRGLEQLSATCAEIGEMSSERTPAIEAMSDHCNNMATALRKIQAQEVAKSRSKRAAEPDYWFEECKVSPNQIQL